MDNLVAALIGEGRFPEAEKLGREVVERKKRAPGPDNPETLGSMSNLAAILLGQGRFAEAEVVCREISEIGERALKPGDEITMMSLEQPRLRPAPAGKLDEAETVLRKVVDVSVRVRGEEQPDTLAAMTRPREHADPRGQGGGGGRAGTEDVRDQDPGAGPRARGDRHLAIEPGPAALPAAEGGGRAGPAGRGGGGGAADLPEPVSPAMYRGRLGSCLGNLGRYAEGERLLLSSYETLAAKLGPKDARTQKP